MEHFFVTERGAEACALSKPRISALGGLPLNRAMADNMAAALALSGRVVATSRAQHCGQAKS